MGNLFSEPDVDLRRTWLGRYPQQQGSYSEQQRRGRRSDLRWVHCTGENPPPPYAISGGMDPDGDRIYVGRAYHAGCQLPAKFVPVKECAYVTYHGQVFRKGNFEVLCGGNVGWERVEDNIIPPRAVVGGRTSSGEALYVGRGYSPVTQMMGKIVPREQTLYIAYEGCEFSTKHYQYLVEG